MNRPATSPPSTVAPFAVLAVALALAAAACATEPPMNAASTPAEAGDLLVEVRSYSRFTGGTGYRVMADGRYESFHSERPGEPTWVAGTPLSAESLAKVQAALAAIDPATLKPRYDSGKAPRDRGDTVWKVHVGGRLVQVEVVPGTPVPELEAVGAAVSGAQVAAVSMEWIVGSGDAAPRYPIRPDADIAALDEVINALIGSGEACSETAPGAGATLVFAVVWKSEGGDERQELWNDGLELWPADGGTTCKRHPASLIESVRGKLAVVDWSALSLR